MLTLHVVEFQPARRAWCCNAAIAVKPAASGHAAFVKDAHLQTAASLAATCQCHAAGDSHAALVQAKLRIAQWLTLCMLPVAISPVPPVGFTELVDVLDCGSKPPASRPCRDHVLWPAMV